MRQGNAGGRPPGAGRRVGGSRGGLEGAPWPEEEEEQAGPGDRVAGVAPDGDRNVLVGGKARDEAGVGEWGALGWRDRAAGD